LGEKANPLTVPRKSEIIRGQFWKELKGALIFEIYRISLGKGIESENEEPLLGSTAGKSYESDPDLIDAHWHRFEMVAHEFVFPQCPELRLTLTKVEEQISAIRCPDPTTGMVSVFPPCE
jgi:hypothetical protein